MSLWHQRQRLNGQCVNAVYYGEQKGKNVQRQMSWLYRWINAMLVMWHSPCFNITTLYRAWCHVEWNRAWMAPLHTRISFVNIMVIHDDVIKWKHFPRYWTFVRRIHRLPVNSPHKGQWRGALRFSLIGAWISGWVNNGESGDLRRHLAHYDVIVM